MNNPNHPKKGSKISVNPIKDMKDINLIKKILSKNKRNYCLFVLGINTNLRASDILNLKIEQVQGLKINDTLQIREQKTKKIRQVTLNKSVIDSIHSLVDEHKQNGITKGYLFLGQRGNVLSVPSLTRLVKSWCQSINLTENYGSHSLRKTWGYQQRVKYNVSLPQLMVCFNHTTQKQTLDYLCIQEDEIKSIYMNEL